MDKRAERFWSRLKKTEGCWLYTGRTTMEGYPRITVDKKETTATRYAWELSNGKLSKGRMVKTTCGKKNCCNPEHLYVVELSACAPEPIRALERHDVKDIKRLLQEGATNKYVANLFGIAASTVSDIKRGRTWKGVGDDIQPKRSSYQPQGQAVPACSG